jgi:hypothetical protein
VVEYGRSLLRSDHFSSSVDGILINYMSAEIPMITEEARGTDPERQVCGFLRVLRFPPSIKLTATI